MCRRDESQEVWAAGRHVKRRVEEFSPTSGQGEAARMRRVRNFPSRDLTASGIYGCARHHRALVDDLPRAKALH